MLQYLTNIDLEQCIALESLMTHKTHAALSNLLSFVPVTRTINTAFLCFLGCESACIRQNTGTLLFFGTVPDPTCVSEKYKKKGGALPDEQHASMHVHDCKHVEQVRWTYAQRSAWVNYTSNDEISNRNHKRIVGQNRKNVLPNINKSMRWGAFIVGTTWLTLVHQKK